MKDHKVQSSPCPYCHHVCDGALSLNQNRRPKDGDLSICIRCSRVSIFDQDQRRKMSFADLDSLPIEDVQALREQVELVRAIIRREQNEPLN